MGDLESIVGKIGFNFRVQSRKASLRRWYLNKDLKEVREIAGHNEKAFNFCRLE